VGGAIGSAATGVIAKAFDFSGALVAVAVFPLAATLLVLALRAPNPDRPGRPSRDAAAEPAG
jgi:hypothetical protein